MNFLFYFFYILSSFIINTTFAFYDDFNSKNVLDENKWLIAATQWGGTEVNGGVSPETVYISPSTENQASKNTLKIVTQGDLATSGAKAISKDGSIRLDSYTRVGGVIATKDYFASGEYEIRMKVAPQTGVFSGFWTKWYTETDDGNGGLIISQHIIEVQTPTALYGNPDNTASFQNVRFNSWTGITVSERQLDRINIVSNLNDGQFHTIKFVWRTNPKSITFYIDGVIKDILSDSSKIPNIAGRLWLGAWFPIDSAGEPNFVNAIMEVDYVSITPLSDSGDISLPESFPDVGWGSFNICNGYNTTCDTTEIENKPPNEFTSTTALYDDFTNDCSQIPNENRWLIAKRQWGGTDVNGGVIPDTMWISPSTENNGKFTLKIVAQGDQYSGPIKGINADLSTRSDGHRVGGCIVTRDYYASGRYEVRMKVAGNLGVASAIWTFHYSLYHPDDYWYKIRYPYGGPSELIYNHEIDIEIPTYLHGESFNDITFDKARFNVWIGELSGQFQDDFISLGSAQNDGNFHTYRFDWHTGNSTHPKQVDFYIDDIHKHTITTQSLIPTRASRFWVGAWFPDKWAGTPDFSVSILEVDYIRITPFYEENDEYYFESSPDIGYGDFIIGHGTSTTIPAHCIYNPPPSSTAEIPVDSSSGSYYSSGDASGDAPIYSSSAETQADYSSSAETPAEYSSSAEIPVDSSSGSYYSSGDGSGDAPIYSSSAETQADYSSSAETPADYSSSAETQADYSSSAEIPVDSSSAETPAEYSSSAEIPVDSSSAETPADYSSSAEIPVDSSSAETPAEYSSSAEIPVDSSSGSYYSSGDTPIYSSTAETEEPIICNNHGILINSSCVCLDNWHGENCTNSPCSGVFCNYHGYCDAGKCICINNWSGEFCNIDPCAGITCSNHGVCFAGVCTCNVGYTGNDCSIPPPTTHFYDNFNLLNVLDDQKWLIPRYNFMDNTVGGVVSDSISLSRSTDLNSYKNTLKIKVFGNLYNGDIKGINVDGSNRLDGKLVGGMIATKSYFTSGSYEIRMKVVPSTAVFSCFFYEFDMNNQISFSVPYSSSFTQSKYIVNNINTITSISSVLNDGFFHTFRFDHHTGDTNKNINSTLELYIDGVNQHSSINVPTKPGRLWVGAYFPSEYHNTTNVQIDFDTLQLEIDYVKINPFFENNDPNDNPTNSGNSFSNFIIENGANPIFPPDNKEKPIESKKPPNYNTPTVNVSTTVITISSLFSIAFASILIIQWIRKKKRSQRIRVYSVGSEQFMDLMQSSHQNATKSKARFDSNWKLL